FGFQVTFHERAASSRDGGAPPSGAAHPDIDALLADAGTSPRAIADRVNGPEFDTDIPDNPAHFNLGNNDTFEDFVRVIGGMLYDAVEREPQRPWVNIVDYYNLPYLPTAFSRGLTRLFDALMAALPDRLSQILQVSLAVRVDGEVHWVPVLPSYTRPSHRRPRAS